MSYIGTSMEYIKVTMKLPTGEVYMLCGVAKQIPLWKADPYVTEIVSEETGEVFYHINGKTPR